MTDEIPIDHSHLLTSDSIHRLTYLPKSLTVLGGGVIACEYASTFAALGVHVTLIDRNPRPLGFVDEELSQGFVDSLKRLGNRCIANQRVRSVHWDGACSTVTELENGEQIRSEKCLVALGRVANTQRLRIDRAQIECRPSGTVITNEFGQSSRENIYAVGDVAGPPGLVAAAIEQGRRAVRSALKLDTGAPARFTPFAVYTIPEMSCVGMDERMAREAGEDVILGHARFDDLVRGKIAAITHGSLKLVADDCGLILGVQIFGEGAAELIAIGQMALRARMHVQDLVDTVFNFPTLSEAYRVAALDIARQWDGTCALPV